MEGVLSQCSFSAEWPHPFSERAEYELRGPAFGAFPICLCPCPSLSWPLGALLEPPSVYFSREHPSFRQTHPLIQSWGFAFCLSHVMVPRHCLLSLADLAWCLLFKTGGWEGTDLVSLVSVFARLEVFTSSPGIICLSERTLGKQIYTWGSSWTLPGKLAEQAGSWVT